jgi:predicted RNA-binding Zn-ribbon protein involved in translation (DUF1610 family)
MANQIRVVDAKTRFDATHFDMRSEYRDHRISIADYTCPECRGVVRFTADDLGRVTPSVLSVEQLDTIERARPLNAKLWQRPLDFRCPNCGLVVRVIAQPGEAYAMGAHDWDFATVVEVIAEQNAAPDRAGHVV